MKYVTKALVFLSLTALMFVLSIEVIKASRDQLRLINAKSLSKSINDETEPFNFRLGTSF